MWLKLPDTLVSSGGASLIGKSTLDLKLKKKALSNAQFLEIVYLMLFPFVD